jgi:hypothetical protein
VQVNLFLLETSNLQEVIDGLHNKGIFFRWGNTLKQNNTNLQKVGSFEGFGE